MKWVQVPADLCFDPRVKGLSDSAFRVLFELQLAATQCDSLTLNPVVVGDSAPVIRQSRVRKRILSELSAAGLVTVSENWVTLEDILSLNQVLETQSIRRNRDIDRKRNPAKSKGCETDFRAENPPENRLRVDTEKTQTRDTFRAADATKSRTLRERATEAQNLGSMAHMVTPQEWPEVAEVARALVGPGARLGAPPHDKGVMAVVALFAAGYSVAELVRAAEAVRTQDWWLERKLGLGSFSPEVVRRALEDPAPAVSKREVIRL